MVRPTAAALLVVISLAAGCGHNPRPASTPPSPGTSAAAAGAASFPPLQQLRQDLQAIYDMPAFRRAIWGVEIRSLTRGDVLYARNADKLLMPASNMKVLIVAAAAERLGWDYRYETTLSTTGPIVDGVLEGDLIVSGSGDPTFNARNAEPARVFDAWADQLAANGIRRIDGRIIGDDDAFDDEGLGPGWSWDYLAYGYAAPGGALQYNENVVAVTVSPGQAPGLAAVVDVAPIDGGLVMRNEVTTTEAGTAADIDLQRLPGSPVLRIRGAISQDAAPLTRQVSVDNPTEYFARALRRHLQSRGIAVAGEAVDVDLAPASPDAPAQGSGDAAPHLLARHTSPPLSDIATVLMKVSQNLYADTLLKTLGTLPSSSVTPLGDPPRAGFPRLSTSSSVVGTFERGREVVRTVLAGWGIARDEYVMYDGSGLSRYNYVSPAALVKVLTRMYADTRHRDAFLATLPIGGEDGTLRRRMLGTAAERNVRAKTGSISNVRSLSGYVTTTDGETLAFSMIANNFTVPQSEVDAALDLAIAHLAEFSRAQR